MLFFSLCLRCCLYMQVYSWAVCVGCVPSRFLVTTRIASTHCRPSLFRKFKCVRGTGRFNEEAQDGLSAKWERRVAPYLLPLSTVLDKSPGLKVT
jgi:hypothetical protein